MATKNGHSRGVIGKVYQSYMFKTKDPVIDELRSLTEQVFGRRVAGDALKEIEQAGGPSVACMRAWYFGKTKRPQNPTIEAAGRAIGFMRVWKPMPGVRPK
jgi:hypothetical protein